MLEILHPTLPLKIYHLEAKAKEYHGSLLVGLSWHTEMSKNVLEFGINKPFETLRK